MSEYTIFYSWQSDAPNRINRTLIPEALAEAVKNLDVEVEDADRFGIDQLLDLKILHSNMSNDGAGYAYHWTPLGRKVMDLIPIVPIDDAD